MQLDERLMGQNVGYRYSVLRLISRLNLLFSDLEAEVLEGILVGRRHLKREQFFFKRNPATLLAISRPEQVRYSCVKSRETGFPVSVLAGRMNSLGAHGGRV
ncbi:MAG: hypothetical protein ABSH34_05120 [Verrucomicrobiota bacterium]|jgi:hypothetical protein